jgi:protein SCO1/2
MCHGLGVSARRAGPDLLGVTERRDHDWLRRWLKDTNAMLAGDPQARAMLQQWNGVRMPQVKLTDADIDALLHYMAQQTQILRGG